MVRQIPIQNSKGETLKTINIYLDGDTPEELEQTRRRYLKDAAKWKKYAKTAIKDGTTADGHACSLVGKIAMQAAEQKLKKMLDNTFGEEVYPAFFSMARPFAAVGGRFYCNNVLDALNETAKQMIGGLLTK